MSKNTLREQRRQKRLARRRVQRTILILAGAVIIALIATLVYFNNQDKEAVNEAVSKVELGANAITTDSGLRYEDLVVGDGAEAKAGNTVSVHYTGWLADGTQFDSSVDSGTPFEFQLGAGRVIQGWDEGVAGMQVGGKRKLVIPPDLGYGATGAGNGVIPPNSVLVFEVELLGIK